MLQICVNLRQNPVLLSSSCANISDCQMIPLVGHVKVQSGYSREIGGIRVVWEAQVQRRRHKRNGKYCWTKGDVFDSFEVEVLRGPIRLPQGGSVFEFVIEVPLNLVSSRTTHFDKITHTLHAAVLGTTPCYEHLPRDGMGRSSFAGLVGRLRPSRGHASKVFGTISILAQDATPIYVSNCDPEEEGTAYSWRYSTSLAKIGHLSVAIDSPQFTLGQTADLAIDITGLSPITTIHSITVNLVQTSTIATCPSKFTTERAAPPKDIEIRSELTEEYQLYTYGTAWSRMPGRTRPWRGSYVWRRSEAGHLVTEVSEMEDHPLDRSAEDGFGLSTTLTLPSPVIGAHPTDVRDNPAFSTVSHHLAIQFEYSILGQDSRGEPLSPKGSEVMEGSVRSWTLEKAVQVHSDLSAATFTAAPPYCPNDISPRSCQAGPDINPKSIESPWSISLGWTKATLMRPVNVQPDELKKRTRRHWEETSGMCACFAKSNVRGGSESHETDMGSKP